MSRVKAIYRSGGDSLYGKQVYAPRHRAEWLGKISETGVRRRAEFLLPTTRCTESVTQASAAGICSPSVRNTRPGNSSADPSIGPIRATVLLGILQTPHRSAPSGSYGGTADWHEHAAAPMTVVSTGSSNEPRNRSPFAD